MDGGNRCIEIEYADADGVLTRRKVNANSYYRPPKASFWYLDGFCHLRREQRTFRTDRITRIWDSRADWMSVGDPTKWIECMWENSIQRSGSGATRPWSDQREATYPADRAARARAEEEARSIVDQHFHALRALIYVAKADKAFRAAEKRLFLLFFKRVAGHRMDTELLQTLCIKAALQMDTPTTGQFHYSVRHLTSGVRRYRMAICATAKAMVNSDKRIAPYEVEVIEYLTRKLRPLHE